jgi:hypothetical protein
MAFPPISYPIIRMRDKDRPSATLTLLHYGIGNTFGLVHFANQLSETAVRGWIHAELGELDEGLAELDRGAKALQASGAVRWRHLGLRGRILTLQGRLDEAQNVLREAIAHG